jgi:hypothetical protein
MSDVEKFWEALRSKWGAPTRSFSQLDPMQQMMLIQSINQMIQLLNTPP